MQDICLIFKACCSSLHDTVFFCLQIARTRELLNWSGSFAAIVGTLLTVGAIKSHKPQLLAPLLPLGYVVGK